MKLTYLRFIGHPLAATLVCVLSACSAPAGFGGFDATASGPDGGRRGDAAFDATMMGLPPVDSGGLRSEAGSLCPSSCAKLNASCGAVTDTVCGGIIQCGGCPAGKTCGGGGVHNVCGTGGVNPDAACAPETCAQQMGLSCGQATDGCGHTLECGTCVSPQTCGGDPTKPGKCGCTGECSGVVACDGGGATTLTGTVYDPAGLHPLNKVLVYVPNKPSDPGLQPFTPGVSCTQCGATAAGDPLVSTLTAPDGTFTLTGVPVGPQIPLVIQLGRWRRQLPVNTSNICSPNAVPDRVLKMPAKHSEGDIPFIAVLTGALDPVECVLEQIGIANSEFTNPGAGGHINFFTADESEAIPGEQGAGAILAGGATPNQAALFGTTGGKPTIDQYDMVILECEGYPQDETTTDEAALLAYTAAGGRVFASDYAYAWLNGNFAGTANWGGDHSGQGFGTTATIDLTSNPEGVAFQKWLENAGISAPGSDTVNLVPAFGNTPSITSPTQQWLHGPDSLNGNNVSIHFTFNTPVGAPSNQQCGRVVFSDWHSIANLQSFGNVFPPGNCPGGSMTAQEAILEYMFFDLAACVEPYTPICTPRTCSSQQISCGPASDGCGNLLDCGKCVAGQTCGGGGPGKCGSSVHCSPETCLSQGIECGPAGDGCGDVISCGNCATGAICGANGPGKCGTIH